jgi:tetratricopeptide (TPR) repeat protein
MWAVLLWSSARAEEDHMVKGRELEERTLYGPAMAEYQRAIKEQPEKAAEAHYRLGMISNMLGNTEGAVQEFRAALQLDPNHLEAKKAVSAFYINRGAAARQQHRTEDALRDLQEATKIDDSLSTAHLELGLAYEDNGQIAEAAKEYQAAVTADPKNISAQLRLGQARNNQKQYEPAVAAFTTVLENNPDRAEAYEGLGVAYFAQGKQDEAKQAFEKAMRKHLVAGRRDLAIKVKEKYDALLSSASPVATPPVAASPSLNTPVQK